MKAAGSGGGRSLGFHASERVCVSVGFSRVQRVNQLLLLVLPLAAHLWFDGI